MNICLSIVVVFETIIEGLCRCSEVSLSAADLLMTIPSSWLDPFAR